MEISLHKLLEKELVSRKKANRTYSLRAFARDMGISAGFLSQLLNGKKSLSPDKALNIAHRLGLSTRESHLLTCLSRYEMARSQENKNLIRQDIDRIQKTYANFERLKADKFAVISDWYHFAILELMEVENFSSNPTWIAKKLQITVTEVTLALDRMIAMKMIEIKADGSLKKLKNNSVKDIPSEAIRKFHIQHLTNAAKAIEKVPFDERHSSGLTMAVDPSKIAEAEQLIKVFRSKMSNLLESGKKKRVYHLAIQLFPLDQGGPHD